MNAEELAGLGRIKKEVEPIKGLLVTFHSLAVREEEEINIALGGLPADILARSMGLQIETLARSIEKIGGKAFTDINELKGYLRGLQRHTLSTLFQCWSTEFDANSSKQVDDLKKDTVPPVLA